MLRSHLMQRRALLAIATITLAACGSGAKPAATGVPDATPAAAASSPAVSLVATPAASSTGSPAASIGSAGPLLPGERIAFGVQAADRKSSDVYSMLADGTDLRKLSSGTGNHLCTSFSPDGKQIAYCADASGAFEIWTMRPDGSEQTQLTKLGGRALFPDVSPDGTKVAFGGNEGSDPTTEVYVVDAATGTGLVALTSCANGKAGCANDLPSWSPDGKQIVFVHQDDIDSANNGVNEQVWVMNADGSHARALTTGSEPKDQVPDWSPDGKRIAYESGNAPNQGIWVMGADGANPHQLSGCRQGDASPCAAGSDFGTAWSPDGKSIAFLRSLVGVGTNARPIYVMAADGTDQRIVSPADILATVPAWR